MEDITSTFHFHNRQPSELSSTNPKVCLQYVQASDFGVAIWSVANYISRQKVNMERRFCIDNRNVASSHPASPKGLWEN